DVGYYGIYPRQILGLKGILTSPLIHGSWSHLINNSIPLFVLLCIIFYFFRRISWQIILMVYLLTGLSVWLFGRPVFHIGASGVIYGLVSFVFWSGLFRKNVRSIVLSLIVLFLYSGMFLGVLPNQPGISWESHLLGGLMGILVAWIYKGVLEEADQTSTEELQDETEKSYFFRRDIFDKTRNEKQAEEAELEKQNKETKRMDFERRRGLSNFEDWPSDMA
ncbi:MAG: rhomboid family intramembrane serine protease, partial [Saprospiraceae bacterium]